MVVVLLHWKIVPAKVTDFMKNWKQEAVVQDRRGLIGEFLTEAHSATELDWITWDLTGGYRSFINVGLWSDAGAFHDQIAMYFETRTGKHDFAYRARVRTLLEPSCWRLGEFSLPAHDSKSVL